MSEFTCWLTFFLSYLISSGWLAAKTFSFVSSVLATFVANAIDSSVLVFS